MAGFIRAPKWAGASGKTLARAAASRVPYTRAGGLGQLKGALRDSKYFSAHACVKKIGLATPDRAAKQAQL